MRGGRFVLFATLLCTIVFVLVTVRSTPLYVADLGLAALNRADRGPSMETLQELLVVLGSTTQPADASVDRIVDTATRQSLSFNSNQTAPKPAPTPTVTPSVTRGSSPRSDESAKAVTKTAPKEAKKSPPAEKGGVLGGHHIIVDPGHGGANSGAIGVNGREEDATVLDIALRLTQLLKDAGATVTLTRDGDYSPTVRGQPDLDQLEARTLIANHSGGEIFISIHDNWYEDPSATGIMAFVHTNASATSESLAKNLYREVIKASGLPGVDLQAANYHVLRETTMPAVLMELGFLSNKNDAAKLADPDFRQKLAQGLFNGVVAFYQK